MVSKDDKVEGEPNTITTCGSTGGELRILEDKDGRLMGRQGERKRAMSGGDDEAD